MIYLPERREYVGFNIVINAKTCHKQVLNIFMVIDSRPYTGLLNESYFASYYEVVTYLTLRGIVLKEDFKGTKTPTHQDA